MSPHATSYNNLFRFYNESPVFVYVPLVPVLALLTRGGAGQRAEEGPDSREQEGERGEYRLYREYRAIGPLRVPCMIEYVERGTQA